MWRWLAAVAIGSTVAMAAGCSDGNGTTAQGGAGGTGGSGGSGGSGNTGGAACTPVDDASDCTEDLCKGGTQTHVNLSTGSPCASGGGNVCDGNGACVECLQDTDCAGTELCSPDHACVPATCMDGKQNGSESDVDCGGPECDRCDDGKTCGEATDCTNGVCTDDTCTLAKCDDSVANGDETDVDCGGSCEKCDDDEGCAVAADCQSGVCKDDGAGKLVCAAPACGDGVPNGVELCDDGNATEGDDCDSNCTPSACGNGVTAPDEACDDGNPLNGDGCDVNCTITACGNGESSPGEVCDDGNPTNGDGCDVNCTVTACGNGIPTMGEVCDDGNPTNGDGCDVNCTVTACGNGIPTMGEACDDGNPTNGDGCDVNCTVTACGNGIPTMGEACDDGNATNGDGCDVNCTVTACGNGIPTMGEACDDGNATNGDGCDVNCTATACGNGIPTMGEACDDGNATNGDGCDSNCTATACGNGAVSAGEGCDDGNALGNDGCSALCAVETPYTCAGTLPSVCTSAVEINCNDGKDNDGNGQIDCADAACALGCNAAVTPCAAGETLLELTAVDTPKTIPDINPVGTTSTVTVSGLGIVKRVAVQLDITHAYDADVDVLLRSPGGIATDVTSDNGTSGDNYTATIFNDACAALVTAGVAPFTGCFKPEVLLAGQNEKPAKGAWGLNVTDDATTDIGTLNAWRLSLCVAQSTCGDGVSNAGETCDDGNNTNGDGCSGVCAAEPGYTCSGTPTVCAPICGDGLRLGSEACDDGNLTAGDGCSVACAVEAGYGCANSAPNLCAPVCGNGVMTAPEACDDGNTVAGDGCDNACQVQVGLTEAEPNGTFAEADTNAAAATPIAITGTSTLLSGAITPVADKDTYKMTVAADGVVRFETFDGSGNDCTGGITTQLRLFNAAMTQIYTDTVSGISSCSALVVNLTAGTYYVQVEEVGNNAAIAAYKLEVKVQTNKGAESEPNETRATSDGVTGSDVYVFGGHQVAGDFDVFAIDVPAGKSLRAETIEGSGAETCESNGIDSRIRLFSPLGVDLGNDSDAGRGFCSLVDGTGTTALSSYAKALPGGTYYVQVEAHTPSSNTVAMQFDYRLVVTVR